MKIFKIVTALTLIVALSLNVGAAEKPAKDSGPTWTDNFQSAVAASKKSGKPILIDFTGSDWCGFCIKQHAEVFDTDTFKTWAKENVILFTADYPSAVKQTNAVKKQNEELKTKYAPKGYPTIVFIDAKGTELGRWAGYGPGSGPDKWIDKAKPIVAKAAESEKAK